MTKKTVKGTQDTQTKPRDDARVRVIDEFLAKVETTLQDWAAIAAKIPEEDADGVRTAP